MNTIPFIIDQSVATNTIYKKLEIKIIDINSKNNLDDST